MDDCGRHGFVCKHARSRATCYRALNDVLARAFSSVGIGVAKEPVGLFCRDVKRPESMTLIPWRAGKQVVWDVTVVCTCAESYVDASSPKRPIMC